MCRYSFQFKPACLCDICTTHRRINKIGCQMIIKVMMKYECHASDTRDSLHHDGTFCVIPTGIAGIPLAVAFFAIFPAEDAREFRMKTGNPESSPRLPRKHSLCCAATSCQFDANV